MSKAKEKKQRLRQEFNDKATRLDLLVQAYAKGESFLPDGNDVSASRIASEIVGKYRRFLSDENGVNYDGTLYADIFNALKAAEDATKH